MPNKAVILKHNKLDLYREFIMSIISMLGLVLAIEGQYSSLTESNNNAIHVLQLDTQDIIMKYYDYRRDIIKNKSELSLDIAHKLESKERFKDYFQAEYNRIVNKKLDEIEELNNTKNMIFYIISFLYFIYLFLLVIKHIL